ncbi:MAG: radical SAM protein [Promethearchaeati archaeon]
MELINKKIISKRYSFIASIRKRQNKIKNYLVIDDNYCTVYTKKGKLSNGCKACKRGKWVCLFLGAKCNANCDYCLQKSNWSIEHAESLQYFWIDDFKRSLLLNETQKYIEGISYSGGEPFIYFDKLLNISNFVKRYPFIYQWVYTNGKLVNKKFLKKLKHEGIKEIRYNLRAFDFNYEILRKLNLSKKIIGKVIVEVPSDRIVYNNLIKNKIINTLEDEGVSQLNLAEVFLDYNKAKHKYKENEIYLYKSPFVSILSPLESRNITYDIIEYSIKKDLSILINDCSNESKDLQIMRKWFNPLAKKLFPQ